MEQTTSMEQSLDAIASALSSVVDAPLWQLSEDQVCGVTLTALRVREGVEELVARLVAEAERREVPKHAGASGMATWLQAEGRLSRAAAGRLVAGTRLLDLHATRRAWAAGAITGDHASVIAGAVHGLGDGTSAEDRVLAEKVILDEALVLGVDEARHVANRVFEYLDPESADVRLGEQLQAQERRAMARTRLSIRKRGDGTSAIHGLVPDLHGDLLRTALEALCAPRRVGVERDPAKRAPFENRMGRAFCELIEHLPTDKLPQSGGVPATITITLDHDKLTSGLGAAMLPTDTTISAAEARRLACNTGLISLVLDGKSQILDVGTEQRLYDRYQRIALAHRDQGCVMRGCDRPPAWCEAHHLIPHSLGGPTTIDNGTLLCWAHHRLIHQPGWTTQRADDGTIEITPPVTVDPHRRPRRHERFQKQRE